MTLPSVRPAAQRWRIVVVEESKDDRAEIHRLLEEGSPRQYEFIDATNSATALKAILESPAGPPDCVVLDYCLPDSTATELLLALTGPSDNVACPVVVITDREGDGHEIGREVLRAGAQDFIGKASMSPATMTRAVENAVERWAMVSALRASEAQLRHLAAAVPQPVWMTDGTGTLVYTNERWRAYFGDRIGEHASAIAKAVVHPDEAAGARRHVEECRQRGEAYEVDARLRRVDGEYRWHRINAAPVRGPGGAITHWYAINTDIHDRKEAELRLRLALEASKTGIWSWDLRTNAITWTPECYAIAGIAESEPAPTGEEFMALLHPDDRAHAERVSRAAVENRTEYQCDFRILRPTGEIAWVTNFGRASYDADGTPLRLLGTVIDISERKRAEAALETRRRELQSLADNSPDVMARLDRNFRHVFMSAAVEKTTGIPPAKFIGKTSREMGMPPEICDVWEDAIRSVFETGQPRSFEFEAMGLAGLGHFASRMVPEVGPNGDVELVLAVTDDRTEQKKAEKALAASEERLARAQDAARIGTWDWNVQADTASWTEQAWRLFGRVPFSAPVTFDLWLHSVHPDDREKAAAATVAALRTGTIYEDEYRVRSADGVIRWLHARGETLRGADGSAVRMLGTVQDVTERREVAESLQAALADAERAVLARDQLVSLVSHDLRNPLNALVLTLSLLDGHVLESGRTALKRMARQTVRMDKMLSELLDLSQLHAGKPLSLQLDETDLVAKAREVLEEHQSTAPGHRMELVTTSEELVGTWDAARIERVIDNLLSNAVKYSPAGGKVVVAIEEAFEGTVKWAVLRVTDEGIGIAAKDRPQIFDWFSRARNARSMGIEGVGVGLAGVRSIVEQHGGSISVESQERKGSTFTVRLPTRPRAIPAAAPSSPQIGLFR